MTAYCHECLRLLTLWNCRPGQVLAKFTALHVSGSHILGVNCVQTVGGAQSKSDTVQAAVVPVLLSTANVSGLEWNMVDGSALVAAQNTATLQVNLFKQYLQPARVLSLCRPGVFSISTS